MTIRTSSQSSFAVGGEFQIKAGVEVTYSEDIYNSVTGLTSGGFVVTWQASNQDGNRGGIYGQRFDAPGAVDGGEFLINTTTDDNQIFPSVTALDDGGFVVTWESFDQDGDQGGVYGQRYAGSGAVVGGEFLINTRIGNDQGSPSVTALNDGGFVVTWQSLGQDGDNFGIYGQRYDAFGAVDGGEFQINTTNDGGQTHSSVTALNGGGFVVTWESTHSGGDDGGVYGQRYDAFGAIVGGEFRINATTNVTDYFPFVTGLTSGGFVVAWQSRNQDSDGFDIYGQRYDSVGTVDGGEFRINDQTQGVQSHPSMTALDDGGFVVTWNSNETGGDYRHIYGQRFDASGAVVGGGFRINKATNDEHVGPSNDDLAYPSLDALTDGQFCGYLAAVKTS